MPRRDHAGIAPAGLSRDLLLALEDDDLVPVLLQLVGGGDADDAATQYDHAHYASGDRKVSTL